MVKTTINVPDNLWKEFSIKVIREEGLRKKNDIIEDLIKEYLGDDYDLIGKST